MHPTLRPRLRPLSLFPLAALAAALSIAPPALAQEPVKRALTHDDYDRWTSLRGTTFSRDGAWIAYSIQPLVGDGTLHVQQVDGDGRHEFARGKGAKFSNDNRRLLFQVAEPYADVRRRKLEKLHEKKKEQQPTGELGEQAAKEAKQAAKAARKAQKQAEEKAEALTKQLHVLDLESGQVTKIDNVKSWRLPKHGDALLVHHDEPKKADDEDEDKDKSKKANKDDEPKKAKGKKPKRKDGTTLQLRDLATGGDVEIAHVRSFGTVADDTWLWYVVGTENDDAGVANGLFARELATGATVTLTSGYGEYGNVAVDQDNRRLAFTSDVRAFGDEDAPRDLYLWTFDDQGARLVVDGETPGMPAGHHVAGESVSFSRDGSVLLFRAAQPKLEELPKILADDEVKLDIWGWQDDDLQTVQAKSRDPRKATLTSAYHVDVGRVVVLGTPELPRAYLLDDNGSRALVQDPRPYKKLVTWDGSYRDVYVVNTVDGGRRRIVEGLRGRAQRSMGGNFVVWFDQRDYDWHCYDLERETTRNLTEDLPVAFDRELDDRPEPHGAHGVGGWTEDDAEVLLYDEFDIWAVDPRTGAFRCVTDGLGRAAGITFRLGGPDLRPDAERDDLADEKEHFVREQLVLLATDRETYAHGYYRDTVTGVGKPQKLLMRDANITSAVRPRDADRLFVTFSRFDQYPDVHCTDLALGDVRRLTNGCPLKDEVRWGSAELVSWRSGDGTPLKGVLVKPDGFDPEKQYPMMVYFYERRSHTLHNFVTPKPGTSPNPAYYVSNGYLWFIPDIVYRDGYPGESCEKCVIPGVQSLIARGFVDPDAIGVAGHSWGGYQTAHLITRTDIFAAAESGAPVVNMFSAYGGIRWGSGMSRQFQYEQTQSRIGGTPWQFPARYRENSPLFWLDKVETPVLILHNDKDGAVPWYQGIEFFNAMRRLGKEAYLFNYNGEDHGLRKTQNQRDWTRRMQQFFDHHLKGAPAPEWMQRGVPFHERMEEKLPFAPSYREAREAGLIEASDGR